MKQSLFAFSLGVTVLISCIAQGQHSGDGMKETWRCFDRYKYSSDEVLVTLSGTVDAEKFELGEVSVAGITYFASFRIVGFNRRWDFKGKDFWGKDLGGKSEYAFVIQPNGHGLYYDFSKVKDDGSTKPSQNFRCLSP